MDTFSFEPFFDSIEQDGAQPEADLFVLSEEYQIVTPQVESIPITFDDFFLNNGAWRAPVPCDHCREMRLQCFHLQTTEANPNPVNSCSSCVALFRECSLAERGKRHHMNYETAEPVIGQLHGVNEEGTCVAESESYSTTQLAGANLYTKRSSARAVQKTRILRDWLANHANNPYPNDEEKVTLARQSGLSKTQISNWFGNARRRQRQSAKLLAKQTFYPQGSPMPQSPLSAMSPFERWRNSPPDEEPAPTAAIQRALKTICSDIDSGLSRENSISSISGPFSSISGESITYNNYQASYTSSDSFSSCHSHESAGALDSFSTSASIIDHNTRTQLEGLRPRIIARTKRIVFQCTFCRRSFKKRSDWLRHERSVHLPGLDTWICSLPLPPDQPSWLVWRVNQNEPECLVCGQTSPTDEHFESHEFDSCAERTLSERTFTRKDHLWQHLYKFHGCRKWEGWKPDLEVLKQTQCQTTDRCGFCGAEMVGWDHRARHLTEHFKSGLTMDQWLIGLSIGHYEGEG